MLVIDQYVLEKKIGSGNFGDVYFTTKKNTSSVFATKKIEKSKALDGVMKNYFLNEIDVLRSTDHSNLIKLYEIKSSKNNFYMIMEYCNGGTLAEAYLKYIGIHNKPFPELYVQHIARQVISGLYYLHKNDIIHRDLKLENIIFHYDKLEDLKNFDLLKSKIKIIDFGFAKFLKGTSEAKSICGSPINMDPIILKALAFKEEEGEITYNKKADIWSLGIIVYFLLIGDQPFSGIDYKDLFNEIKKGNYKIPKYLKLSKQAISLINGLLQFEPNDRLGVDELIFHEFLIKDANDFEFIDLNRKEDIGLNIILNNKQDINKIWDIYQTSNNENLAEIKLDLSNTSFLNPDTKKIESRNDNRQITPINIMINPENPQNFFNHKKINNNDINKNQIVNDKGLIGESKSNPNKNYYTNNNTQPNNEYLDKDKISNSKENHNKNDNAINPYQNNQGLPVVNINLNTNEKKYENKVIEIQTTPPQFPINSNQYDDFQINKNKNQIDSNRDNIHSIPDVKIDYLKKKDDKSQQNSNPISSSNKIQENQINNNNIFPNQPVNNPNLINNINNFPQNKYTSNPNLQTYTNTNYPLETGYNFTNQNIITPNYIYKNEVNPQNYNNNAINFNNQIDLNKNFVNIEIQNQPLSNKNSNEVKIFDKENKTNNEMDFITNNINKLTTQTDAFIKNNIDNFIYNPVPNQYSNSLNKNNNNLEVDNLKYNEKKNETINIKFNNGENDFKDIQYKINEISQNPINIEQAIQLGNPFNELSKQELYPINENKNALNQFKPAAYIQNYITPTNNDDSTKFKKVSNFQNNNKNFIFQTDLNFENLKNDDYQINYNNKPNVIQTDYRKYSIPSEINNEFNAPNTTRIKASNYDDNLSSSKKRDSENRGSTPITNLNTYYLNEFQPVYNQINKNKKQMDFSYNNNLNNGINPSPNRYDKNAYSQNFNSNEMKTGTAMIYSNQNNYMVSANYLPPSSFPGIQTNYSDQYKINNFNGNKGNNTGGNNYLKNNQNENEVQNNIMYNLNSEPNKDIRRNSKLNLNEIDSLGNRNFENNDNKLNFITPNRDYRNSTPATDYKITSKTPKIEYGKNNGISFDFEFPINNNNNFLQNQNKNNENRYNLDDFSVNTARIKSDNRVTSSKFNELKNVGIYDLNGNIPNVHIFNKDDSSLKRDSYQNNMLGNNLKNDQENNPYNGFNRFDYIKTGNNGNININSGQQVKTNRIYSSVDYSNNTNGYYQQSHK